MPDEQARPSQSAGTWPIVILLAVVVTLVGSVRLLSHKREVSHDAFAQCLAAKKVTMYGLYWCQHCADQKEMFGPSFQYVIYIECGIKGSREEEPACIQAGIKNFPAWKFPDGSISEGTHPLKLLSEKSGCTLQ